MSRDEYMDLFLSAVNIALWIAVIAFAGYFGRVQ